MTLTHQRWVHLQGEIGEVYNIGTQKERTVMDVAHQIAKIFKLPEVPSSDCGYAISHCARHRLSNSRKSLSLTTTLAATSRARSSR